MRLTIVTLSLASLATLQAGCLLASPGGAEDAPDSDTAPPGHGTVDPAPAGAIARGAYQVRSVFDVTTGAVLPQPAYELVATLRDFSTAPAHTLIDLADDAGVPAVSELRALLPDVLESRLEGWIDDQIEAAAIDGIPVTQLAAQLAALGDIALTRFAIDSALTIDGAAATHRLARLDFAPAGLDASLSLADLPASIGTASATAAHAGGGLTLGDHRFGIPFGDYAWQAVESVVAARHGAGVRGLLGAAVDCPALADAVANHCVLGVCVGGRDLLVELCERGLDEVVGLAQRRIAEVRFDAIRLAAGTTRLDGADTAGVATRLTGGVWTAQIDAGQGLRPVPASFTGAR
jgi:hypothetical protein